MTTVDKDKYWALNGSQAAPARSLMPRRGENRLGWQLPPTGKSAPIIKAATASQRLLSNQRRADAHRAPIRHAARLRLPAAHMSATNAAASSRDPSMACHESPQPPT
jgi:hypothetical protein